MAKKFFYVCGGLLMLALAYHFGATTATAQAPGNPIVAAEPGMVYTANGDLYVRDAQYGYHLTSNVFNGSPTPAKQESWGQVKARYR